MSPTKCPVPHMECETNIIGVVLAVDIFICLSFQVGSSLESVDLFTRA